MEMVNFNSFFFSKCYSTNDNEKSTTKSSSNKKVSAQCSSSTDEGCETDMGNDAKGKIIFYKLLIKEELKTNFE